MPSFPLAFSVGVCAFREGAVDAHGNPVDEWDEPVSVRVYGWGAPMSDEPAVAGHDRVAVDVKVYVPAGFSCGPHDRVVLDGATFDVVGLVEDYTHNPFGWSPGGVLNLRKVEG